MKRVLLFLLLLMVYVTVSAQTKVSASLGDGVKIVAGDSSFSVKLGLRFQTLYQFSSPANDISDINSRFLIRRSRLKADGFIFSPRLVYKFELGLSGNDIGPVMPEANNAPLLLYDAVLKYTPFKGFTLWAGQTKLPGNRERVISSQELQFVDRSLLNSNFNLDRDIGIQAHMEQEAGGMVFREILAFSQGEGRNILLNNQGFSYMGRIEWLPFGSFHNKGDYVGAAIYREESPKLSLAAAYEYNDEARREGGQLGSFLNEPADLQHFFADMMFKWRGWSVMSEYATRDFERKNVAGSAKDVLQRMGHGFNFQTGYLFESGFEVAGRYTLVDYTTFFAEPDETQYTIGFSRYFSGHDLKLQSDFSYTEFEGAVPDGLGFRLQFEVAL